MDRRVAGVLLLVVALVATLAVPNTIGHQIAGAAVSETIAGPPTVGQCVGALTSTAPDPTDSSGVDRDEDQVGRPMPVATVVPCRGSVLGEIISVSAQGTRPEVSTLQEFEDANPSCRSQVESYLGTRPTTELSGVQWTKSIYVDARTVGPDAYDRAAGRTWTACVLSPVGATYTAPPSLKSSWTSGTVPDVFGLCWADTIVQHGVPTTCTTRHTTQQLAFGFVPGPSDSSVRIVSKADNAGIVASCRQLAAAIMNVPDPTFGGALTLTVVSDPAGAPYVQCAVSAAAGKSLVGSLIGLGGRALPLA